MADVILCDLSAHNPNVYLELGWALRADKRFVLIKDDVTQFNFDLHQFYTYQYSHKLQPSSLKKSIRELSNVIRDTLADKNRKYSMVNKLSLDLQTVEALSKGDSEEKVEVRLLMELLSEVRASGRRQSFATPAPNPPKFSFPHIETQADLYKMLIGTTWRKQNDVEHVIFQDDSSFYNNHAGVPKWHRNTYSLGERLGTMTLIWGSDGFDSPCKFNEDFNQFVEIKSPRDCKWWGRKGTVKIIRQIRVQTILLLESILLQSSIFTHAGGGAAPFYLLTQYHFAQSMPACKMLGDSKRVQQHAGGRGPLLLLTQNHFAQYMPTCRMLGDSKRGRQHAACTSGGFHV